jgi:hypothetical protein
VIRVDGTVHERIDATWFDLQSNNEGGIRQQPQIKHKNNRCYLLVKIDDIKRTFFNTNDDAWTAGNE